MKQLLILTLLSSLSLPLWAISHVGVIVKKSGDVEVLTNPSKTINGKGPHILFEGMYYTLEKGKLGLKVLNGNIVRTGKEGKAKIVYKNGDQLNVGIGTAYKIEWKGAEGNPDDSSAISLMYGSIRGIVEKDGPRSGMQVKTRNAVMGIRGTDFHIGQRGTSGESTVAVMRGKVQVAEKKDPRKKLEVKKGFKAEVNQIKDDKKVKVISNLVQTTKDDLAQIQKESTIKKDEADATVSDKTVAQEIEKLEKEAVKTTLNDIKEYEPELYQVIKQKELESVDAINTVVVAEVAAKAPVEKVKPGVENVNFNPEAYKEYFDADEY